MKRWLTLIGCMLVASMALGQGGETGGGGGPGGGGGNNNLSTLNDDAGCLGGNLVLRNGTDTGFDCLVGGTGGLCVVSNGPTAEPGWGACGGTSITMPPSRLLGRTTTGTGAPENISVTSAFTLSATTLDINKIVPGKVDTDTSGDFGKCAQFNATTGTLEPAAGACGTSTGMTSFSFGADSGVNATVTNLDVAKVAGGTGIATVVTTADPTHTVTVNLDLTDGVTCSPPLQCPSSSNITTSMTGPAILGRTTGTGTASSLTGTQATALLDTFSSSAATKGLVTGSSGLGSTYFLNATGSWAVPPGGSAGYATVQDAAGTAVAQRNTIQFTGSGVTSVLDNTGTKTVVTLSGGGTEVNNLSTTTQGIAIDQVPVGSAPDDSVYLTLPGAAGGPAGGTQGCSGSGDALQYNTTTHAFECQTGLSTGGGITSVAEVDLVPTVTSTTALRFDQTSGFVVAGTTGTATVSLSGGAPASSLDSPGEPGTDDNVLYSSVAKLWYADRGSPSAVGTGDGAYTQGVDPVLDSFPKNYNETGLGAGFNQNGPGNAPNRYGAADYQFYMLERDAADLPQPANVFTKDIVAWMPSTVGTEVQGGPWPPGAPGALCTFGNYCDPNLTGGSGATADGAACTTNAQCLAGSGCSLSYWPNCNTTKNHLGATWQTSHFAGEGETVVDDGQIILAGAGDKIAWNRQVWFMGPTPESGDEGAAGMRVWVFDYLRDRLAGSLAGALTRDGTDVTVNANITLGGWGRESLAQIGKRSLIVFNDSSAAGITAGYKVVDAGPGAGLIGFANTTPYTTYSCQGSAYCNGRHSWRVAQTADLPTLTFDPDVGFTGFCFALDAATRQDYSGTSQRYWLPIIKGPGVAGCPSFGTCDAALTGGSGITPDGGACSTNAQCLSGSGCTNGSSTCASDEFETVSYSAPKSNTTNGAPPQYVPGKVWNFYAGNGFGTGAATDDGIIAPCEILDSIALTQNPVDGFPNSAANYPLFFKKTHNRPVAIPSGMLAEFHPLAFPDITKTFNSVIDSQTTPGVSFYASNTPRGGKTAQGIADMFAQQFPVNWGNAACSNPADMSNCAPGAVKGVAIAGPRGDAAFYYGPWEMGTFAAGGNFSETAPTVATVIGSADWGNTWADHVIMHRVNAQNGTGYLDLDADTSTNALVWRNSTNSTSSVSFRGEDTEGTAGPSDTVFDTTGTGKITIGHAGASPVTNVVVEAPIDINERAAVPAGTPASDYIRLFAKEPTSDAPNLQTLSQAPSDNQWYSYVFPSIWETTITGAAVTLNTIPRFGAENSAELGVTELTSSPNGKAFVALRASASGDAASGGAAPSNTTGAIRLDNGGNGAICWEASPNGTDQCLTVNASELLTFNGAPVSAGTGLPAHFDGTDWCIDQDGDNVCDPTEINLTVNAPTYQDPLTPSSVGHETVQGNLIVKGSFSVPNPAVLGGTTIADKQLLIGTGPATGAYRTISGDVTLSNAGAVKLNTQTTAVAGTDGQCLKYESTAVSGSNLDWGACGSGAGNVTGSGAVTTSGMIPIFNGNAQTIIPNPGSGTAATGWRLLGDSFTTALNYLTNGWRSIRWMREEDGLNLQGFALEGISQPEGYLAGFSADHQFALTYGYPSPVTPQSPFSSSFATIWQNAQNAQAAYGAQFPMWAPHAVEQTQSKMHTVRVSSSTGFDPNEYVSIEDPTTHIVKATGIIKSKTSNDIDTVWLSFQNVGDPAIGDRYRGYNQTTVTTPTGNAFLPGYSAWVFPASCSSTGLVQDSTTSVARIAIVNVVGNQLTYIPTHGDIDEIQTGRCIKQLYLNPTASNIASGNVATISVPDATLIASPGLTDLGQNYIYHDMAVDRINLSTQASWFANRTDQLADRPTFGFGVKNHTNGLASVDHTQSWWRIRSTMNGDGVGTPPDADHSGAIGDINAKSIARWWGGFDLCENGGFDCVHVHSPAAVTNNGGAGQIIQVGDYSGLWPLLTSAGVLPDELVKTGAVAGQLVSTNIGIDGSNAITGVSSLTTTGASPQVTLGSGGGGLAGGIKLFSVTAAGSVTLMPTASSSTTLISLPAGNSTALTSVSGLTPITGSPASTSGLCPVTNGAGGAVWQACSSGITALKDAGSGTTAGATDPVIQISGGPGVKTTASNPSGSGFVIIDLDYGMSTASDPAFTTKGMCAFTTDTALATHGGGFICEGTGSVADNNEQEHVFPSQNTEATLDYILTSTTPFSGSVAAATGTPGNTTYLRGDGAWKTALDGVKQHYDMSWKAPVAGDDVYLKTSGAVTLTSFQCLATGGSSTSALFEVFECATTWPASGVCTGTAGLSSSITGTSPQSPAADTDFTGGSGPAIPTENWFRVSPVSGTMPSFVHCRLEYTQP